MPLTLSEVPVPTNSDATDQYYPTFHKAARAPSGGYVECQTSRVQKYLDKLCPSLKEAYIANPTRVPGIDPKELADNGGLIAFKPHAALKSLPARYKMFESRKAENLPPDFGTPLAPGAPPLDARSDLREDTDRAKSEEQEKAKAEDKPKDEHGTNTHEETNASSARDGDEADDTAAPGSETLSAAAAAAAAEKRKDGKFRADAFIFGHPSGSKFRSTTDFLPHMYWLVTDETKDHTTCPCKLCVTYCKSKTYPRGRLVDGTDSPAVSARGRGRGKKQGTPASRIESPAITTGKEEGRSRKRKAPSKAIVLPSDHIETPHDWDPDLPSTALQSPESASRDASDDEGHRPRVAAPTTPAVTSEAAQPSERPHSRVHKSSSKTTVEETEESVRKSKYKKLKAQYNQVQEDNDNLRRDYEAAKKGLARLQFERRLLFERVQSVEAEAGQEGLPLARIESSEDSDSQSERTARAVPQAAPIEHRERPPLPPTLPQRPANAYAHFCNQARQRMMTANDGIKELGEAALTKRLKITWKGFSAEERAEWRDSYMEAVNRYDELMKLYSTYSADPRANEAMHRGGLPVANQHPAHAYGAVPQPHHYPPQYYHTSAPHPSAPYAHPHAHSHHPSPDGYGMDGYGRSLHMDVGPPPPHMAHRVNEISVDDRRDWTDPMQGVVQ
ncbi:hypothetical protein HKX48_005215 [Thoreauomyces humboldtii]|nr:hypothetical protein HKX48_005215 [Thoreauomyces humboldtii]